MAENIKKQNMDEYMRMLDFPMHRAAHEGDLERVSQLLKVGVSVDSRDRRGRTPLHRAAERGQCEVAELLIRNKCDLNLKDSDGRTPAMLASKEKEENKEKFVNFLVQCGAQVNCADDDNFTLLHFASLNGWLAVVCRLLAKKADPNAVTRCGDTPLLMAAREKARIRLMATDALKHALILNKLILAGADVNRSGAQKMTALHWVAHQGCFVELFLLLKKEGLSLNPQDKDGCTPLHYACRGRNRESVKLLLEAGADTNIRDNHGITALMEGISRRTIKLYEISLFIQCGAFFEEGYMNGYNPDIKEHVLKDVGLCTQSIVNKFHRHSLPVLYSIPRFARILPNIKCFKLSPAQERTVANFVEFEIEKKTFCNVAEAQPMVLQMLCILSLLARQE